MGGAIFSASLLLADDVQTLNPSNTVLLHCG